MNNTLPRMLVALCLVIPAFARVPQGQPPAKAAARPPAEDVAWKYGLPVPAGAVAVVDDAVVPMDLFLDEMAAHFTRVDQPLGRQMLDAIIDETLVANEAARRGYTVSESDVDKEMADLDQQLRKNGTTLEDQLKGKNVPRDQFIAKLKETMLLKQLAREDQRVPAPEPVSNVHMGVWLKNRKAAAKIETDRAKIEKGVVAIVDGAPITQQTFVRAVLPEAARKDVRDKTEMLMQYVLMTRVLAKNDLALTDADVETEFADRRKVFEANPQMKGIDYMAFVKERTGLEAEDLKKSRAFRLHAAVSKLGRKLFSPTDVKNYYAKHLDDFGPRFTVRHLMIRGADKESTDADNKVIIPSKAKAREQIATIQAELKKGKRFEDLVQMYSEHTATKFRGGVLEPFTPKSAPYDSFAAAVKDLKAGEVSAPVETPVGVHLVKVDKIEPAPPVEAVEADVRQNLGFEYFSELYKNAKKGADIHVD